MAHIRQRAELVLEPIQAQLVQGAQHLDRDMRLQLAIEGLVNDAHPARTEPAEQRESAAQARLTTNTQPRHETYIYIVYTVRSSAFC